MKKVQAILSDLVGLLAPIEEGEVHSWKNIIIFIAVMVFIIFMLSLVY